MVGFFDWPVTRFPEEILKFSFCRSGTVDSNLRAEDFERVAEFLVEGAKATSIARREGLHRFVDGTPDCFRVRGAHRFGNLLDDLASKCAMSARALRLFISATSLPSGSTVCRASSKRNAGRSSKGSCSNQRRRLALSMIRRSLSSSSSIGAPLKTLPWPVTMPRSSYSRRPSRKAVTSAARSGAHALGLKVQPGKFSRLDATPQGDGIGDAYVVGQVPIAQSGAWW